MRRISWAVSSGPLNSLLALVRMGPKSPARNVFCLVSFLEIETEILTNRVNPSSELRSICLVTNHKKIYKWVAAGQMLNGGKKMKSYATVQQRQVNQ